MEEQTNEITNKWRNKRNKEKKRTSEQRHEPAEKCEPMNNKRMKGRMNRERTNENSFDNIKSS